jgi:hypothetical protein
MRFTLAVLRVQVRIEALNATTLFGSGQRHGTFRLARG